MAARGVPPLRPRDRQRDTVHRLDTDRRVRRQAGLVVAARAVPVLRAVVAHVLRVARMVRRADRRARVGPCDRPVRDHAAVRRQRPAARPRDRPLRADVALDRAVGPLARVATAPRARDRRLGRRHVHRRAGARLPAVPRARAVGRRRAAPAPLRPAAAPVGRRLAAPRRDRRRRARPDDGARGLFRAPGRGDLGRHDVLRDVCREPQRAVQPALGLVLPARPAGNQGRRDGGLRVPRRRRARAARVRGDRPRQARRRLVERQALRAADRRRRGAGAARALAQDRVGRPRRARDPAAAASRSSGSPRCARRAGSCGSRCTR